MYLYLCKCSTRSQRYSLQWYVWTLPLGILATTPPLGTIIRTICYNVLSFTRKKPLQKKSWNSCFLSLTRDRQCQILNQIAHCPCLCLLCIFAHEAGFIDCTRRRISELTLWLQTLKHYWVGREIGGEARRLCVCVELTLLLGSPSRPASESSKYPL